MGQLRYVILAHDRNHLKDLVVALRRFLFHTALGSGPAAGLAPLAAALSPGEEPVPVPDFATSLGREDRVEVPDGEELRIEVEFVFSPGLVAEEMAGPLDARNVLLTETALKVAGFLTVDDVLPCPFSPSRAARDASVSDPPLTLTSAELS